MLLSVEEAQKIILDGTVPLGRVVTRPLTEALGCLVGQDIASDHDIPPFTNSAMDGYAVRAEDVREASQRQPVSLAIKGIIRAGHPTSTPVQPGECYKIMTGAPMPPGADAVVPIESTEGGETGQRVQILDAVPTGGFVRNQGEDMRRGRTVITRGTVITAPVIGILASVGADPVAIIDPPKVALLSTGDELREPNQELVDGTIRNSNSYALHAAIREAGGNPTIYPSAPDDPQAIRALIEEAASESDLLVTSGGVSVGDFDFVKTVIESLGHLDLWRVNLKPGKPLAFGHVLGVPIVGLPGNPVSALTTCELFVRPLIRMLLGDTRWPRVTLRLPLAEEYSAVEDRRQYVRSRLLLNAGQLMLWPHRNQGSAVQSTWQDVDALMIVPEHTGPLRRGDTADALILSLQHVQAASHG